MSEPTKEERARTIKAAHQLMQNLMAQYADDIREHQENIRYLTRRAKPQEDPQEQATLNALLSEISQKKNGGK